MTDYRFLMDLLPELELYRAETGLEPGDLREFGLWLAARHAGEAVARRGAGNGAADRRTSERVEGAGDGVARRVAGVREGVGGRGAADGAADRRTSDGVAGAGDGVAGRGAGVREGVAAQGADAPGRDGVVGADSAKVDGAQNAGEPRPNLELKLNWNGKGRGGKAHYTASNLLTALSRYKMNYVRLALDGTPFETYDEFAFVLSLVFAGPYTQSQLIERHVQLKPTGMEVIRRLLRKGLIIQEPSDSDKRSKVLKATDAGRRAFHQTLVRINAVTDAVMAPLSDPERLQLLEILQKLEKPHREMFLHNKKMELNELLDKFGVPPPGQR